MDLNQQNLAVNLITLGAIIGALFAVGRLVLTIRRLGRLVEQFFSDWTGTPARRGYPSRPGIPERLEKLEAGQSEIRAQLRQSATGDSLRDAVDNIPPNDHRRHQ